MLHRSKKKAKSIATKVNAIYVARSYLRQDMHVSIRMSKER